MTHWELCNMFGGGGTWIQAERCYYLTLVVVEVHWLTLKHEDSGEIGWWLKCVCVCVVYFHNTPVISAKEQCMVRGLLCSTARALCPNHLAATPSPVTIEMEHMTSAPELKQSCDYITAVPLTSRIFCSIVWESERKGTSCSMGTAFNSYTILYQICLAR